MADMNWGRMRFSNLSPVSNPVKPRRDVDNVSLLADLLSVLNDKEQEKAEQENVNWLSRERYDRGKAATQEAKLNTDIQNLTKLANSRFVNDVGMVDQRAQNIAAQARDTLAAKYGLKGGLSVQGGPSGPTLPPSILEDQARGDVKVTGGTRDTLDLLAPSGQRATIPQGMGPDIPRLPSPGTSTPKGNNTKPGIVLPIRKTSPTSLSNLPVPGSQEELLAANPEMATELMKYQLDQERADLKKKTTADTKKEETTKKITEKPPSAAQQKINNLDKARQVIVSNPEFAEYIDIKGDSVNVDPNTPPDIKREINKQLTARTSDIELPLENNEASGVQDLDRRNEAREILRKAGKPVTDANIDHVVKQMR